MSIPTTSAPNRARGTAVVPSPQPRSKTRSGVVIPRDLTTASPDCRIKAAISVKSPFSHNALFGFMIASFYYGAGYAEPAGAAAASVRRTHSLIATSETLLTPYFFVAPWAFVEMNRYCGFSFSCFTRSPAASIAET